MNTYRVAVLVGSLRRDSFNGRLAQAVRALAPAGLELVDIAIDDLPLYNQDDDERPAASVLRLKDSIRACDGLLFFTPEYNRSVPGVLKNALDHGSRPYGQSVWAGKPAAIAGVSPGAIGTALAQQHLRSILAYLDVPLLGQPELYLQMRETLFDGPHELSGSARPLVQSWLDRYVAWLRTQLG